jgi:2'-5' RNA ligase
VRLFIAVDLDPAVRQHVIDVMSIVRNASEHFGSGSKLRWVSPENLHLTLRFLGHMEDARGAKVQAALQAPIETARFVASLDRLGAFPPGGAVRVVWLGLKRGATEMRALFDEVEHRVTALGFESEARPFSAHLTLARVADGRPSRRLRRTGDEGGRREGHPLRRVLSTVDFQPGPEWLVDHVTLYESRLSPRGPTYSSILRSPLKASDADNRAAESTP